MKHFFAFVILQITDPFFYPVMSLVGLLESTHWEPRDAASDALLKLADHGQFLSG